MKTTIHTYRKQEYSLTITDGYWFLDCSLGEINGELPINSKEVNKGIRLWKEQEAIKKANAPKCKGCKKDPTEIKEYQQYEDPIQFVKENERLINSRQFYCTSCYIKAGMPLF